MPHVLNYPEICHAANTGKIIYEESRTLGIVRPLKFDGIDFVGVKHNCTLLLMECDESQCPDYNLFYRCWDEEPSDSLKDSVPWKENTYAGDFK